MVRPTDQQKIATEKIICYSRFPTGSPRHKGATQGSTRFLEEAEGMRGKCEQEPLLSFLWEEKGPMGLRFG